MEVSKDSLERLSEVRLQEAKFLLDNQKYSGAYYIAGYSVELAIKACITKNFRTNVLPDKSFVTKIYIHDLEKLIGLSGLKDKFDAEKNANQNLKINWATVQGWSEEARYFEWDAISATTLYNAIADQQNGVLQ